MNLSYFRVVSFIPFVTSNSSTSYVGYINFNHLFRNPWTMDCLTTLHSTFYPSLAYRLITQSMKALWVTSATAPPQQEAAPHSLTCPAESTFASVVSFITVMTLCLFSSTMHLALLIKSLSTLLHIIFCHTTHSYRFDKMVKFGLLSLSNLRRKITLSFSPLI